MKLPTVSIAVLALAAATATAQTDKPQLPKPDQPHSIPATPLTKPAPGPSEAEVEITLRAGDKAPAITVDKWVKGDEVKALEPGRVYIVEFWATWCGPCIEQIPHLTEIQKKHKDVTVLAIAASERAPKEGQPDERLAKVEAFVKDKGDAMGYRVAYDSKRAMSKSWMAPAGRKTIPTSFLVGADGKIAFIGHPNELDAELAKVLAKSTPSKPAPAAPDKK